MEALEPRVMLAGGADLAGLYDTGDWFVQESTGQQFAPAEHWGRWIPEGRKAAWVDIQAGDFNGDGRDDIAGRHAQSGTWFVGLSTGNRFTEPAGWSRWRPGGFYTWADVQVGDFNGDGRDDIAGRHTDTGVWFVSSSTGRGFETTGWGRWQPDNSQLTTWSDVRIGDFNSDNRDDIAGRHTASGTWFIGLSTGRTFTTTGWGRWQSGGAHAWDNVRVGDFNGDGRDDVIGRHVRSGTLFVGLSDRASFRFDGWGHWSAGNWQDVHAADMNGDGNDDVIGRHVTTGTWFVGLSNRAAFNVDGWGRWSTDVWADVHVEDFNDDGADDVAGRHLASGTWFVSLSDRQDALLPATAWGRWLPGNDWRVLVGNFS